MEKYPDNPIIMNCEISGYPDGKEPEMPRCPICGCYCDSFYRNKKEHRIIGCEYCIKIIDSYYD